MVDLLRAECLLQGVYPVWTGQWLTLRRAEFRAAADAAITLDDGNGAQRPTSRKGTEQIVNAWALKANRSPSSGEWGLSVAVENVASQHRWGVRRAGSAIEHRGLSIVDRDLDSLRPWIARLLESARVFADARWLVERDGTQETMGLRAGDVVLLTESWVPAAAGGLGVTSAPALVLSTAWDIGRRANRLSLLALPTMAMLAPAWKLSSYDSGTLTIGIDAGVYGPLVRDDGLAFLAAGDSITIRESDPADPAAPQSWTRTVDSVSGADIVHQGAALAGYSASTLYTIVYDVYGSCTTAQRAFAFIADDATGYVTGSVRYLWT